MDKTGHMTIAAHTAGRRNGRQWMWRFLLVAVLLLAVVAVSGICLEEQAVVTDFSRKNLPPCLSYLFGTDWMGRDMLSRTCRTFYEHPYRCAGIGSQRSHCAFSWNCRCCRRKMGGRHHQLVH